MISIPKCLSGYIVGVACLTTLSPPSLAGNGHNSIWEQLRAKCETAEGRHKSSCMTTAVEQMQVFRNQVADKYRECLESDNRRICDANREEEWSKIMSNILPEQDDLPR